MRGKGNAKRREGKGDGRINLHDVVGTSAQPYHGCEERKTKRGEKQSPKESPLLPRPGRGGNKKAEEKERTLYSFSFQKAIRIYT